MRIARFSFETNKLQYMDKTLEKLRLTASVLLGFIGIPLVFNESNTFVPNFIGLACYALLIVINRNKYVGENQ